MITHSSVALSNTNIALSSTISLAYFYTMIPHQDEALPLSLTEGTPALVDAGVKAVGPLLIIGPKVGSIQGPEHGRVGDVLVVTWLGKGKVFVESAHEDNGFLLSVGNVH